MSLRHAYGCTPSIMSLYFANTLVRRAGLKPACILLSTGGLRFQKKHDTPAQVLSRDATDSHLLLKQHVEALERGEPPAAQPIDVRTARPPYRSWPEHEELRRFQALGSVFWRAPDFRRVLGFEDVNAG
ncbi:hypothetical protein [Myxococcus sp. Y35]|uniref:hypothetical protein n=1 Tax=Pseudomyxococcus flavus TaxID=3115648 RepID=UPI003CEC8D72